MPTASLPALGRAKDEAEQQRLVSTLSLEDYSERKQPALAVLVNENTCKCDYWGVLARL